MRDGRMVVVGLGLVALALAAAARPGAAGAASHARPGAGAVVEIAAAEMARLLQRKDFTLVNVHVPYEGEIPGTDLNIPYDQIPGHLDRLPRDRSAPLVIYCRTGRMSAEAVNHLLALGFTNLRHFGGGMVGWERAGHRLVHRPR